MNYKNLCLLVAKLPLSEADKITAAFFLGQSFLLRELQTRAPHTSEISLAQARIVVPPELIEKIEHSSDDSASRDVLEWFTGMTKLKHARESWID